MEEQKADHSPPAYRDVVLTPMPFLRSPLPERPEITGEQETGDDVALSSPDWQTHINLMNLRHQLHISSQSFTRNRRRRILCMLHTTYRSAVATATESAPATGRVVYTVSRKK